MINELRNIMTRWKGQLYIGVNGALLSQRRGRVADVVRSVKLSEIISETDAPYLGPSRHVSSSPLLIPRIITAIAVTRQESLRVVAEQLAQNEFELWFGGQDHPGVPCWGQHSTSYWPQGQVREREGWTVGERRKWPWHLEVYHPRGDLAHWRLDDLRSERLLNAASAGFRGDEAGRRAFIKNVCGIEEAQ
jgi:hypothetical protein